jgi:hypothetical protein
MPAKAYWIRMRPSPEAATRTPTCANANPLIPLIVHCGCRTKKSGPGGPVSVAHFVATHRCASVRKKYDAVSQNAKQRGPDASDRRSRRALPGSEAASWQSESSANRKRSKQQGTNRRLNPDQFIRRGESHKQLNCAEDRQASCCHSSACICRVDGLLETIRSREPRRSWLGKPLNFPISLLRVSGKRPQEQSRASSV